MVLLIGLDFFGVLFLSRSGFYVVYDYANNSIELEAQVFSVRQYWVHVQRSLHGLSR